MELSQKEKNFNYTNFIVKIINLRIGLQIFTKLNPFYCNYSIMGDSDDEYDRKRRDKFRGERGGGERGGERERWPERER